MAIVAREKESFSKRGEDKKTLLHLLVENARPGNASVRLHLVKWLLQNHPELLDQEDNNKQTPLNRCIVPGKQILLEYLLDNYRDQCKRILAKTSTKGSCLHAAISSRFEGCAEKMLDLMDEKTLESKDSQGNTPLHLSVDVSSWQDWTTEEGRDRRVRFIQSLINRCGMALKTLNKENRSPYQHHLFKRDETLKKAADQSQGKSLGIIKMKLLEEEKVSFMLKDACVHLPSQDAELVLYGDEPGRLIGLDFSELAGLPLPKDYLERLCHLSLENILKFVYLPKLTTAAETVERPHIEGRGSDIISQESRRTTRFTKIFEWLRQRGVKKILQIIVDDDNTHPHGDDELQTALDGFGVESLDWRKVDLCSQTIKDATPNVREVVLRSSGNRAVLWSWSGEDGLIVLPELHSVRIEIVAGVESIKRTSQYLNEFKSRLRFQSEANKRNIKIHIPSQLNSQRVSHNKLDGAYSGSDKQETDSWLGTMGDFTIFLQNIPDGVKNGLERPIRIALLDDGVDTFADELTENIKNGQSFCQSGMQGFGVSNYFVSAGGHGTAMAKLICKVFCYVELLVVKLDGAKTGHPTAESAAQGIRWARLMEVDIISMSWSIVQKDRNHEAIKELVERLFRGGQAKWKDRRERWGAKRRLYYSRPSGIGSTSLWELCFNCAGCRPCGPDSILCQH